MSQLPKTKICKDCGERKCHDAFYVDRKREGTLHTYCKECCNRRAKESYARSDKAERNRIHREWVQSNREHIRAYKTAHAIGVPLAEVKSLLARGKCDLCGATEKLCIDHCHRNGHARGLLCQSCNKGLGFFRDDPALLRRAEDYIRFKPDIFEATYEAVLEES